ncbi:protein kinase [Cellulomonas sp. P22]|uniref:serine/threonine-protein kinase n=1 Tax=Cellulomonas sp. P22 TaxID=3373189 RepID=UPI003795481F
MERIGLEPGSEVGGYTIVAPLGSGGMGTVYRALDGGGTPVALKLLHPHVGADPVARDRLRREVVALQRLHHPGVAAVLDAEADSTEAFIVTELVAGRNLEEHVRRHGPLDPDALADFADGLHDALAAVHAAGVVHRDLKPSNVLVTDAGPVLIDFGIAQAADDPRLTSTGLVIGSPGYLAPELLEDAEPTAGTDWWGWAALLAFAATGRPPFGLRPLAVVITRAREGDVDVEGLGPLTAQALRGALAPEPAARLAPEELVDRLHDAAERGDEPVAGETVVLPGAAASATQRFAPSPVTERLPASSGTERFPADQGDPTAVLGAVEGTRAFPAPPPPAHVPRQSAFGRPDAVGDTAVFGAATDDTRVDDGAQGHDDWFPDHGTDDHADHADHGQGDHEGTDEDDTDGYVRPPAERRWGTLLALGLLAVVAAAVYPGVTLVVLGLALVLTRTVGSAVEAMHTRRERHGVRRTDPWRSAAATPWHLVRGVVGLVPSVVVGASVAIIVGGGLWWAISSGQLTVGDAVPGTSPDGLVAAGVIGVAFGLGLVCTWWGPLSRLTRTGARRLLAGVAPGPTGATVVVLLALIGTVVLAFQVRGGHPVVWAPLPEPALP